MSIQVHTQVRYMHGLLPTLPSLSDQLDESINYEDTNGPLREPDSEKEEEFEPPFPNRRTASNQILNEDEEDFIVPFPPLQDVQRNR